MKIILLTTMPPSNENDRLAIEAKKLGHQFKLVNLSDLTISIKNNKIMAGVLTETDADLVIVRGVLSSIKIISALVKDLRKRKIKVFDNNFLEHEYSINKVTDLIKLAINKIPVPDSINSRDFSKYSGIIRKLGGYPIVIKSTKMGKGAGVYKIDSKTQLSKFIAGLEAEGKQAKNYIVQEFIPYVYDIRALIVGDRVFAMRRIPGEGEFRANFSLGGAVEPFDLDKSGRDLAISALSAIGMTVGGVDILITKNDVRYILEVNHNAGFTGMERASGENIARVFLTHAIEKAK